MPNHFHWLIKTQEGNLVAGMKWFLGAYTQGFNARHGQRGHVFQGRYKALPVEAAAGPYFETVSTYIHLNPARAKLLGGDRPDLRKYIWSSYPLYLAAGKLRPDWLEVGRVLGNIGLEDTAEGRRRYENYVNSRVSELRTQSGRRMYKEQWDKIRYGWCLGGDEFQEKMLERVGKRMEGRDRSSYSGEAADRHGEKEAEKRVRKGMKVLGVKEEDLLMLKKGSITKSALAWYIHSSALVSHKWITERLKMGSPSNLTLYIKKFKEAAETDVLMLRRMLENA